MPWVCRANGCHENDDFSVEMWETRPDLMVHSHAPTDKDLDDEQGSPKAWAHPLSANPWSEYTGPWCSGCESTPIWKDDKEDK